MIEKRDRLLGSAAASQRGGQYAAANQFARQAIDLDSSSIPGLFLAGVSSARLGDPLHAEEMFLRLLKLEPGMYEALISLSTLYREGARVEESIDLARRALAVKPTDAQAHNNIGLSLLAARELDLAANAFQQAIKLQPNFAAAHHNLGKVKQYQGRDGEAARSFFAAASLSPTVEYMQALGQMLLTLCDFESALDCAKRFVALHPTAPAAHLLLCGVLTELNDYDGAEFHLQQALTLDPDRREALHLAARQRPLGHIQAANENLRHAIRMNPRQVSAYDALIQNEKITEPDRPLVDQMREMLRNGGFSPTELVSLHYGLGKGYDDLREYELAMHHYDEANRLTRILKFGDLAFDEVRYRNQVDTMIARFSNPTQVPPSDSSTELPVFIIGMMRSGTTLAEQILSSHPKVAAAGEQLFWTRNWPRAVSTTASAPGQLGEEYVQMLRQFGTAALRITDKMPGNYMFAGLIHQELPRARLIHMRRHPIDTCLSIWATPNHMPHEGGHDKGNIAFVYREYLRLMEHWRTLLPNNSFLEVDYEELVEKPEVVSRRMIEFCGLEWDEACLRPEENKRLVATPSAWQVRQPVYGTSVARWKRFEPWLGKFGDLR